MRQDFKKPAWMNDWKVFLLFSMIAFAFAFGLRCLDLPKWDNPNFMVNGEYIMGTHDAYYWLAGAKGVGSALGNPMSGLIRFLGSVTGAQYGNIAFWLPAVFAGFCAIAAFAWGMLVAGPWVGLAGAVYATSIPAYFFRTRLAYYDTDVVTLLFPLLISVLLARWVSLGIRGSWVPIKNSKIEFNPTFFDYCLPVVAGALTSYGNLWHGDMQTFGIATVFVAVALAMVCGTRDTRAELMRGIVFFCLVAFAGWVGFAAILLLVALFRLPVIRNHKMYNNEYCYLAAFLAIIFLSGVGLDFIVGISGKIASYMKPAADISTSVSGPVYPGIAQSVIEAQNISINDLLTNLTGSNLLGWLGIISFSIMLFRVTSSLFLLPFAVVTFAAVYMGGRFSMFGGIAIGVGISYLINMLIEKFAVSKVKMAMGALQVLLLSAVLFSNVGAMYLQTPPTPIMGNSHAVALIESGKVMPEGSTVWTWWDWGYAASYYTGKHSFADGSRHGGSLLFPLAFAYTTPYSMQSSQLMRFSADNGNNPASVWDKMKAKDVQKMLQSFGAIKYKSKTGSKQYIVLTWENLRLAYWILYYGSWNIIDGGGVHPNCIAIRNPFTLEPGSGVLNIKNEGSVKLSGYAVLNKNGSTFNKFANNIGPEMLYSRTVNQGMLVDDFLRRSMLVKLLIEDPASPQISEYFKIVYDDFPNVRVYEVL
ncbi:STT3 domain-containing protein [Maridesulfovibrio ferrireducens]|uniref:STT3 domain-containing protein n=1 Tax=Maridesulfovibrio ferrireducens TaxID=246191 RepID=UPI001A34AAF8|nr:STT3 domain-containing protein [Maridesulfovibrio ferrireducens]MBI9112711.1 hypothetical protein [Maridesulfovibrio ferrireducens]